MATNSKISPIENLNNFLRKVEKVGSAPVICFLTGSSGCGKTYLGEALSKRLDSNNSEVIQFDSIGILSEAKMIEGWRSGRGWQKAMIHEWVRKITEMKDKVLVIFEGHFDPQFALDACKNMGIEEYGLAIVSCDESVWEARLHGPRRQTELITKDMRNWTRVLKNKTVELGGSVIDTSASDVQTNLDEVASLMNPLLNARIIR